MGVGRQAGRVEESEEEEDASRGWEGERMEAVEGPPEGLCRKAPARFHGHRVYTPPLPRKEGYISHSNAPVPPLVTPSRSVTVRSPRPAAHFRLLCARNPLPLSLSFSPLSLPPLPSLPSLSLSFSLSLSLSPHHEISYAYPNDDAAIEIRVVVVVVVVVNDDAVAFRIATIILPSFTCLALSTRDLLRFFSFFLLLFFSSRR